MDRDDGNSGSIFSTSPFSWVLVPLVIFFGLGAFLIWYRYRRRQKLRMRYGTNALERDLEAMGNRPRPRIPTDRRTGRDRRLIFGLGSREEGLNELGEAPPAYTAPQKRPDDTEAIELAPIHHPPGATTVEGAGTSGPPAYDELQRVSDPSQSTTATSTSNVLEPPPRAVLSSS
ncbi:hypothetical protein GGR54DRAFT_516429 [Hypoxylon sp. NC1633]|nr:hypothetical protein GGR54DRAFT_516429 [Hypoxylon sp. NC1633]